MMSMRGKRVEFIRVVYPQYRLDLECMAVRCLQRETNPNESDLDPEPPQGLHHSALTPALSEHPVWKDRDGKKDKVMSEPDPNSLG